MFFKLYTDRFLSAQVYLDRFFSDPDLFESVPFGSGSFGYKKFRPQGACNFLVLFRTGYFRIGSGSDFRVHVKMPRPSSMHRSHLT